MGHRPGSTEKLADLKTPQLSEFVTALNRILAQLRDAVPTRPADAG